MWGALPGQYDGYTATPRNFLFDTANLVLLGMQVIDSTNGYDGGNTSYERDFREGLIMAQVTSGKKWVPCKRTTTTSTGAVTSLVVVDARAFKVGDVISVGADTGITITAIDYTTNTLTIASTTVASGEAVICTSLAGSEIARGLLYEFVSCRDTRLGTVHDVQGVIAIAGCMLDTTGTVLGDLAACKAATNKLTGWLYASDYGLA